MPRLTRVGLRGAAAVAAVVSVASCGGSASPTSPAPGAGTNQGSNPAPPVAVTLSAPINQSPEDDAPVPTVRPELRFRNALSSAQGQRTYEVQVADEGEFLEQSSGVVAPLRIVLKREEVPEGTDGVTAFQVEQDLTLGRRYYWRARAKEGTSTGPWSHTTRFRTPDPPANESPRLVSLQAAAPRVEADREVALTARVEDLETPPGDLIYEWTAPAGSFVGTGPEVRWRAPAGAPTPAQYDLQLTVIDRYTVTDLDGEQLVREHRVRGSVRVRVHNSDREITGLVLTFLGKFVQSNVSPEECVRGFTDSCGGKADELDDIRENRRRYTMVPAQSSYRITSIAYNGDATVGFITADCTFVATVNATGRREVASGTCALTANYERGDWYLCDSLFAGTSTSGLRFIR